MAASSICGQIQLWELSDRYVLQPLDHKHQLLSINRSNGEVAVIGDIPSGKQCVKGLIYGVLGAVKLRAGTYFLVVNGKQYVGKYANSPVYKVTSMKILHCGNESNQLAITQQKEEAYFVKLFKYVKDTPGLLFSYEIDLSNNAQGSLKVSTDQPLWKQADPRFVWNSHLLEVLLTAKADAFILPVIQGSFQTAKVLVGNRNLKLTLISRRCTRRIGTRMWRRGADSNGSVANFVETEQIVEVDGYLGSYTQVRGSIPLFWEQIVDLTYKPKIKTVLSNETEKVTERHFHDLRQRYGSVLAIDLINQQGGEAVLGKAYKSVMQNLMDTSVRYVAFDFHRICGQMHFERLASLHDQIAEHLLQQRYFLVNAMGEVVAEQSGVVRTNCIDCLDRTNVTQSLLGRKSLEEQLRTIGLFNVRETVNDHPVLDAQFNILWANHGDDISLQYSGTRALKGDFVRYGKRTVGGLVQDGFYSMIRYYRNNFEDGIRQDAMDIIAGHFDLQGGENQEIFKSNLIEYITYGPLIALVMIGSIICTSVAFYRRGESRELVYTFLWASITAVVAAAIKMNGRHICSKPRLLPIA